MRKYEIAYETTSGKQTMPNLLSLDGDTAELYKRIEDKIKADTVSKIQTMFEVHFGTYTDKDMTPITEVFKLLDQIAKEMEGEYAKLN